MAVVLRSWIVRQRDAAAQWATLVCAAIILAGCATAPPGASTDPLPSWTDGANKAAIIKLVQDTTRPGSPDFVPQNERIATFDNDGTLWVEQPMYSQLLFALDRVKQMAPR